ncbi:MAG: glycosyltransferase family 4 protein [Thermoleophilaceae bacterium]
MSRRPRLLMLSPRNPAPPTRGDQVRVYHLARALSARADVMLVCFGAESGASLPGVALRSVPRGVLPAAVANLRAPNPLLPLQTRLYLDGRMHDVVRAAMGGFEPDVLHVTLARMAPYMRHAPPGVHVHLDFVDALSLNMASRANRSRFPPSSAFALEARLMARYEARVAAAADTTSVVSERDRLASPGLARATVIPNGVALDDLPYAEPSRRAANAIFFGNLGYFHNVAPARLVALEVLPRLRRLAPEASLRIAGARPAAAVRDLAGRDGIEVAADVPSMSAELHRAAVAVLPASSGSGIKNKVLEAFAAGTPVVTNRAGIDGIVGAQDRVHYLEAEGADALAEASARLLADADERVRIAAAARALVEREYGWERRADALLELYGLGGRTA